VDAPEPQGKGIEHAKDIEYSFLLGRKSATTPGATEDRTTGGALSFITTNQTDAGGDLSEAEFNAFMLQAIRYGSGSKLALASGVVVSALNKFPASKQQTRNDETTYGMNVTHYTSPFGSLNLVYHKLLEGSKYGGYLILVDMDEVAYRYLGNDEISRDTKVLPNRQPNDQDGRKDEMHRQDSARGFHMAVPPPSTITSGWFPSRTCSCCTCRGARDLRMTKKPRYPIRDPVSGQPAGFTPGAGRRRSVTACSGARRRARSRSSTRSTAASRRSTPRSSSRGCSSTAVRQPRGGLLAGRSDGAGPISKDEMKALMRAAQMLRRRRAGAGARGRAGGLEPRGRDRDDRVDAGGHPRGHRRAGGREEGHGRGGRRGAAAGARGGVALWRPRLICWTT
jgi:hypothetical protein